jgi:hypothetical protein
MLKAWRAYRSLDSEQKGLIAQKQIKLRRPIDELIALLKPIADMDAQLSGRGAMTGCLMVLAIPLALITQAMAESFDWPASLRWILFIGCAALFFVPLYMYVKTRPLDVSDNLRGAVMPILYVFRDDIDPQHPVELALDLRQPTDKAKLLREEKPRERLTEKFYSDPWLAAEAVLIDGSRLRLNVTDTIRHRTRTKKSSSGKWKTKTKNSKKCDIDVELTVRNKAYAVRGGEAGEKKTTLTANKTLKLDGITPTDPKVIVEVVAGVFRQLSPAK